MKQELKHEPVSTRVKLKILPHLLRSRLAAECFPANIQVCSFSVLLCKIKILSVDVRLIVVENLPVDEEFMCAVITFPSLNRSCMMVCLEQTPTINFCRSRCSLSITSVWCKGFFYTFGHDFSSGHVCLSLFLKMGMIMFFRCPDTNKPLGLMLLNGLTKLINEYKEVKQCKT